MEQLDVKLELRPFLRAAIVGEYVDELISSFGDRDLVNINLIQKGIVENQYITNVLIDYERNGKRWGTIDIEIDYDRLALNINSFGKELIIDPGKSVTEQICAALSEVIRFVRDYREENNCRVHLSYRIDWRYDAREVRADLGLSNKDYVPPENGQHKSLKQSISQKKKLYNESIGMEFSVRAGRLDEVIINGSFLDPESMNNKGGYQ